MSTNQMEGATGDFSDGQMKPNPNPKPNCKHVTEIFYSTAFCSYF